MVDSIEILREGLRKYGYLQYALWREDGRRSLALYLNALAKERLANSLCKVLVMPLSSELSPAVYQTIVAGESSVLCAVLLPLNPEADLSGSERVDCRVRMFDLDRIYTMEGEPLFSDADFNIFD